MTLFIVYYYANVDTMAWQKVSNISRQFIVSVDFVLLLQKTKICFFIGHKGYVSPICVQSFQKFPKRCFFDVFDVPNSTNKFDSTIPTAVLFLLLLCLR